MSGGHATVRTKIRMGVCVDGQVIRDLSEVLRRDARATVRDLIVAATCLRVPWSALAVSPLSSREDRLGGEAEPLG